MNKTTLKAVGKRMVVINRGGVKIMTRIPRNSPCPCGSGKKYKNCCIDKGSGPETTTGPDYGEIVANINSTFNLIKKETSERVFESIDELNNYLHHLNYQTNNISKIDFLGLSSTQMAKILYTPFSSNNGIFKLMKIDNESLERIPIIKSSLYFLKVLEAGELKATQLGNLPKHFIQDLHGRFFSKLKYHHYIPHTEDSSYSISSLRRVLMVAGLIKLRSKKFSITEKGKEILSNNDRNVLFKEIFVSFVSIYNWGYWDRYPEFHVIQSSCIFNIYMLHKKAQDWIEEKVLGALFVKAFPALKRECDAFWDESEKTISNCFCCRFLERFCLPFGLIEEKNGEEWPGGKTFYRITPVFRKLFTFS